MRIIFTLFILLSLFNLYSEDIGSIEALIDETCLNHGFEIKKASNTNYKALTFKENAKEFVERYYMEYVGSFNVVEVLNISVLESTLDSQRLKVKVVIKCEKDGKKYKDTINHEILFNKKANQWELS